MSRIPYSRRWTWAVLAWLALVSVSLAQGQVQVKSQLSSGVVKLGGGARLVVYVENGRSASIVDLPSVEGIEIGPLPQPSHRSSTVYANRRRTYTETWSWGIPLTPKRAGEFTIPPVTVRVDGRDVLTRPLSLTVVNDLRGEELGEMQLEAAPKSVVEGQPFSVEIQFGWDLGLNRQINFANLALPWWGELPGVLELEDTERGFGRTQLEVGLNRTTTVLVEELGVREVRGREFRMFRLRRTFIPTRAGELEFPKSFLEFRQLIRRGGGSIFNQRPDETETYYVSQPGFTVTVDPLPDAGRPYDFTGAVGHMDVRAEIDRRDVDAGDSIKLTLEWSGQGNFEFFDVPDLSRLDSFADFRVYGTTETRSTGNRVAVFDIAPISSDVHEVPRVPLSIFDTELRAYRTVESPAIPIRVRALADGSGLAPEEGASTAAGDILDIATEVTARAGAKRLGAGTLIGTMAVIPVLWFGLRRAVRKRGDPDAPGLRRRRGARRKLKRELARCPRASDQLRAVGEFLAARTSEADQAWIGRDVNRWFEDREVADPRAIEPLVRLLERLERAAYAEDDEPLSAAEVLSVAESAAKGGLR